MNISLSHESFPLSEETAKDMGEFLDQLDSNCQTVAGRAVWRKPDADGFAVVAYTEDGELKGFATAIDVVGLRQYEWTAAVSPDIRRQSVGTALADGIRFGLEQRGAVSELAAFPESEEAEAFLQSLKYVPDFKEIQLQAAILENCELPHDIRITPYNGERAELEMVLTAAYDEEVLPVMEHNFEDPAREVWLMKREGRVIASAVSAEEEGWLWVTAFGVTPAEQGHGYGQAFLRWMRQLAGRRGLRGVMLDVDTGNEAVHVYEKAGFQPVSIVSYWHPPHSE